MPIYEYTCQSCGNYLRISLSYDEYDNTQPECPNCQSKELKRRITRIGVAKSEDARMESLMDDTSLAGLDEEDPRALGRFMRKMSNEMGEDMGEEFNEVVGRLESGESPESIEESMPDLGGDLGSDL